MRKYIWLISLFVFAGCGSRKVDKTFQSEKNETSTKESTDTKAETTAETSEKTLLDFFESNMNFGIKPIGETPAKFVFIHNGQKIEGETSGELNFSNQQTRISKVTEIIQKIHTTFQTKTFYQTKTTHKTVFNEKHSESKRPTFAWYILSFVVGMAFIIAVQVLWKNYGGGIIDRFKNGKIKF